MLNVPSPTGNANPASGNTHGTIETKQNALAHRMAAHGLPNLPDGRCGYLTIGTPLMHKRTVRKTVLADGTRISADKHLNQFLMRVYKVASIKQVHDIVRTYIGGEHCIITGLPPLTDDPIFRGEAWKQRIDKRTGAIVPPSGDGIVRAGGCVFPGDLDGVVVPAGIDWTLDPTIAIDAIIERDYPSMVGVSYVWFLTGSAGQVIEDGKVVEGEINLGTINVRILWFLDRDLTLPEMREWMFRLGLDPALSQVSQQNFLSRARYKGFPDPVAHVRQHGLRKWDRDEATPPADLDVTQFRKVKGSGDSEGGQGPASTSAPSAVFAAHETIEDALAGIGTPYPPGSKSRRGDLRVHVGAAARHLVRKFAKAGVPAETIVTSCHRELRRLIATRRKVIEPTVVKHGRTWADVEGHVGEADDLMRWVLAAEFGFDEAMPRYDAPAFDLDEGRIAAADALKTFSEDALACAAGRTIQSAIMADEDIEAEAIAKLRNTPFQGCRRKSILRALTDAEVAEVEADFPQWTDRQGKLFMIAEQLVHPLRVLRITPGAGKTRAAAAEIADLMRASNLTPDAPALLTTPRLELCQDIRDRLLTVHADAFTPGDVQVLYGRLSGGMCQFTSTVEEAVRAGVRDIEATCCKRKKVMCPALRNNTCKYYAQFDERPKVVLAPHERYIMRPEKIAVPSMIFVDETLASKVAKDRTFDVSDIIRHTLADPSDTKAITFEKAFRRRLYSALHANGAGHLTVTVLLDHGITPDDVSHFLKVAGRRGPEDALDASVKGSARKALLDAVRAARRVDIRPLVEELRTLFHKVGNMSGRIVTYFDTGASSAVPGSEEEDDASVDALAEDGDGDGDALDVLNVLPSTVTGSIGVLMVRVSQFVRPSRLMREIPTIFMDATAFENGFYERITGKAVDQRIEVSIKAEFQRIRLVLGAPETRSKQLVNLDRHAGYVVNRMRELRKRKGLVVTHKLGSCALAHAIAALDASGKAHVIAVGNTKTDLGYRVTGFPGIDWIDVRHYGGVSGLDHWGGADYLCCTGQPRPTPFEIERETSRMVNAPVEDAVAEGEWFPREFVQQRLRGGGLAPVWVDVHADGFAEDLRRGMGGTGEVIQAYGRGRGINRQSEAEMVHVDVLANVVLPDEVDEVVHWDAVKPNAADPMIEAGLIVCGADAALAIYPQAFKTRSAARWACDDLATPSELGEVEARLPEIFDRAPSWDSGHMGTAPVWKQVFVRKSGTKCWIEGWYDEVKTGKDLAKWLSKVAGKGWMAKYQQN